MRLRNRILLTVLAAIVAATPVLHSAHSHHGICESSSGTVEAQCAVCAVVYLFGLLDNDCADLAYDTSGTDVTLPPQDRETDTLTLSTDSPRGPPIASV
jgi:hypothetical protein